MKIFHIVNNIAIQKKAGGAELFSIRLLENLPENFDCHLIIIWKFETNDENEVIKSLSKKIRVHFLGDYSHKLKTIFLAIKEFINLLQIVNPKLIHSHSELPDIFGVLAKLLYKQKIGFVRTMHTDKQWQKSFFMEVIFVKLLLPLLCDYEIAISEMTKRRLDKRFIAKIVRKQSIKIYNGIDEKSLLIKYMPKSHNYPMNNFIRGLKLISTGRLTEQKGYIYLIKAISILSSEIDVELWIFGDGDQRPELENLIQKLNIQNQVKLLGHNKDACSFYKDFDVFISSSNYEGFPTVILEAMALNLPVIATDVSGSRELIINMKTGLLVPPKKPIEIHKALEYYYFNYEKAREFASNAREFVKEFGIENIVKEYQKIYQKLDV